MSKSWFRGAAALALLAGCASAKPNPRLSMRYEKSFETFDATSFIARAAGADVKLFDLGRTAWVSHHVAVVKTEERPHYHRFHDLTVMLLSGEGVLNLEQKKIVMKAGDVAHVQRGFRHFFRNTGKEPAATFVTFSPPFDGRDTVTAEDPAAGAPASGAPSEPHAAEPPSGAAHGASAPAEL